MENADILRKTDINQSYQTTQKENYVVEDDNHFETESNDNRYVIGGYRVLIFILTGFIAFLIINPGIMNDAKYRTNQQLLAENFAWKERFSTFEKRSNEEIASLMALNKAQAESCKK